jgi:hypothetical protein
MSPIVVTTQVGEDGVLDLRIPLGKEGANRKARITVETLDATEPARITDQASWQRFVESTSGCITDDTFERPEQGEVERREDLP